MDDYSENRSEKKIIQDSFEGIEEAGNICWCQHPEILDPILSVGTFGNEVSSEVYYQAAAVLVVVPQFTSQHGSVADLAMNEAEIDSGKTAETRKRKRKGKREKGKEGQKKSRVCE